MSSPLALAEQLREELAALQEFFDLERAWVEGEETSGALFAAQAHLQSAQGLLEHLGSMLADEVRP